MPGTKYIFLLFSIAVSLQLISQSKDSAQAYLHKGQRKVESGDLVEAIRWFTKSISNDSSLTAAWLNRAQVKTKLMDYKSAISDYNRAMKIKGLSFEESYELHFNRGLAMAALADLRAALSDFSA